MIIFFSQTMFEIFHYMWGHVRILHLIKRFREGPDQYALCHPLITDTEQTTKTKRKYRSCY